MDEKLMKKMMNKKDDGSSNMKKDAKLNVLKELRKMASEMMGEDVKSGMMKKVTVAAPSSEGLKHGLEKAEDLVEDMPEGEEDMEMSDDSEDLTSEEIDAKIAELQAAKQKLSN